MVILAHKFNWKPGQNNVFTIDSPYIGKTPSAALYPF
jgi:hypothetical protein